MSVQNGVIVHLIDGADLPREGASYLTSVEREKKRGLTGKALIRAVLTDDWGATPVRMDVFRDGQLIERVPYT